MITQMVEKFEISIDNKFQQIEQINDSSFIKITDKIN